MPTTLPAFLSRGSTLLVGDGATPPVFTRIARITKATPSGSKRAMVDATNADSPGTSHESIPGSTDEGTWQVEMNWIPDDPTQNNVAGLEKFYRDGVTKTFRSVYNTIPVSGETFNAYLTDLKKPEIDATNNLLKLSATLQITGMPTPYVGTV